MDDADTAFLAAIQADPCAAGPRLIYADWLDEHGRAAEAEWLRQDVAVGDEWLTRRKQVQGLDSYAVSGTQPAGVEPLDLTRILAGWVR